MAAQKNALVLLDGSQRSLMTVDYIAGMQMFQPMKVVLYTVFTGIPECYWDLEKEPSSVHAYHELRAWEKQKKEKIEEYMAIARSRLVNAGFPNAAVEVKIHDREKGIARDILKEAQAGYHTVVLRRRGMGQLEGISMGSVATKLLSKMTFLPIQVAGRKEQTNRILIGVDGSTAAAKAVDFVAENLGKYDCCVMLLHVIRGFGSIMPENPEFEMPAKNVETAEANMQSHFKELREKLLSSGFKPESISEKIITGAYSRAGAIVMEAECGNYSTIVVGRRGLSKVREFFMGRVCQKVVQVGRYHTVWII